MKIQIKRKLSDVSGESLSETLIALLISALALVMLAGAISAAGNLITKSKDKMAEYYNKDAALALQNPGEGTNLSLTLTDNSNTVNSKEFDVNSYSNGTFGANNTVISYVKP